VAVPALLVTHFMIFVLLGRVDELGQARILH
jgi:hypothetical protein